MPISKYARTIFKRFPHPNFDVKFSPDLTFTFTSSLATSPSSQLRVINGIIRNSLIFLKTTIVHPDNLPPKVSIFAQNWNATTVWLKKACTRISMAREAEFGGKSKRRMWLRKDRQTFVEYDFCESRLCFNSNFGHIVFDVTFRMPSVKCEEAASKVFNL